MIESPNLDDVLPLLRQARDEDLGSGDITSEGTIAADAQARGTFLAKERGVLCGTVLLGPLAAIYSETLSPRPSPGGGGGGTLTPALSLITGRGGTTESALRIELAMNDGDHVTGGDIIGRVVGPARAMLAFERVALNFLQRLSGIATATRAYVDAVEEILRGRGRPGSRCQILDTRKTTPGWRMLEKYAVRCGGGTNHRVGLFDAILVKDNHIALGRMPGPGTGGQPRLTGEEDLPGLARHLRARYPRMPIEIEVDTLDQFRQLLTGAPEAVDMVLLDNMTVEQMTEAVRIRNELGVRPTAEGGCATLPLLEASGGITLSTVRAIAETGVERISVGAITHSAKALDISLEVE